jgi:hypothetical protein
MDYSVQMMKMKLLISREKTSWRIKHGKGDDLQKTVRNPN